MWLPQLQLPERQGLRGRKAAADSRDVQSIQKI